MFESKFFQRSPDSLILRYFFVFYHHILLVCSIFIARVFLGGRRARRRQNVFSIYTKWTSETVESNHCVEVNKTAPQSNSKSKRVCNMSNKRRKRVRMSALGIANVTLISKQICLSRNISSNLSFRKGEWNIESKCFLIGLEQIKRNR